MASTEHIEGNKYKIYVELGYDDYGKRKRRTKTVTATSNRDLKKKALEFELECLNTPIEDLDNITFGILADKWWENHVMVNLTKGTRDGYLYYLPMAKEFFGKMKLKKIKRIHLDEFFKSERSLGRKSLNAKLNMLRSIFKYAMQSELITTNPTTSYTLTNRTEPEEREIYDNIELERFYNSLDSLSDRNRLMLLAASLGGLRRGEVLGISEDVIDFENNTINIVRSLNWDRMEKKKYLGTVKNNRKRKIVYPSSFINELKLYLFKQRSIKYELGDQLELVDGVDLLFRTSYGAIMHPQSFTNLWKKINKQLGLKEINLHDLRHSAATYLIRDGASVKSVQDFLGHKQYETTMNTYVHVVEEDKEQLAAAFEKLL